MNTQYPPSSNPPEDERKNHLERTFESITQKWDRLDFQLNEQPRTRQRKEAFLIAYHECYGVISHAAQKAGIKSTKTVYNWLKDDPYFKVAVDNTMRTLYDSANDKLMEMIQRENITAIKWFLDRKHPAYKRPRRSSKPPQKPKTPEMADEIDDEEDYTDV